MPPNDLPARPTRRSLGRGPGTAEEPQADPPRDAPVGGAPEAPRGAGAPTEPRQEAAHRTAREPAREPVGESASEPAPEAAQEPAPGAAREPVPGTHPEPAPGAAPEPVRVAATECAHPPAPEPAPEPAREGGTASDGRFTLRLANFEGPFDLLLQLISRHKLDVTEVALSKVTDEFMAHIRAMGPDWDLDQTTEFLVVAATLLDLKAARLLPAAEVEDEADLALLEARDLLFARLLQYRAYKRIAEIFELRAEDEGRRHPRTVGLEPHHADLLPEVVISIGAEGLARLAVRAMQPKAKPEVYVDHIHAPLVSVREQAGHVVRLLKARGEATFQELTEDAPDTLTVVARFLALLELYRERAVVLDQEEALRTLTVRWSGGDGDGMPKVTDEFDQVVEAGE
ncbi:segregation/condensation protein A [Streptomyces sp. DK15]|uniref:segregation and condensation protein A n=1 Tax=Streptomyces sp. DK15 TaxID=2957499 RepID=UPI0029AC811B|nr:segregation/condensation protein A [Streptomyces sp. DK15]MDX2395772.1 segregation/condensation protein A [Streptomyces sp. DK15]